MLKQEIYRDFLALIMYSIDQQDLASCLHLKTHCWDMLYFWRFIYMYKIMFVDFILIGLMHFRYKRIFIIMIIVEKNWKISGHHFYKFYLTTSSYHKNFFFFFFFLCIEQNCAHLDDINPDYTLIEQNDAVLFISNRKLNQFFFLFYIPGSLEIVIWENQDHVLLFIVQCSVYLKGRYLWLWFHKLSI
jgi:hypothetical protein